MNVGSTFRIRCIGTYFSTAVAWPELLGALFAASQSTDAAQRETAFRIFSTTPGIIEKQHEDVVISAFKTGFADGDTSVEPSQSRLIKNVLTIN
jgi:hypothetical protein